MSAKRLWVPRAGVSRRRFLEYIGAGSLLAAGGGLLSGCGGSGGGGGEQASEVDPASINLNGPIEVEFWHIQATIYGEAVTEIVRQFNETNEFGITVNEVFQGEYGELNQKIRAALQGGGLPDVAMAYEDDTLEYIKAGVVAALDPFIEGDEHGLSQEELDDIAPGVLERQRVEAYEGATMSWPHGNSSQGVYYNEDVLREAGHEQPADNWDDFMRQMREIRSATDLPSLPFAGFRSGVLHNMMRSMGVSPWEADGSTSNYDSPETLRSLEMIQEMYDEGFAYDVEDSEQEFTNTRSAMEMGTTARTSSKIELIGDRFPWGITLTPQGGADEPITELYGGNQVLFDNGDEQRLLAGWLFMKYFANTDAQAIYATRTGYFPATLSAQETRMLSENYEQYPQKQQAFEEVYQYARIYPPTAAGNAIGDMVEDRITELTTGRTEPQAAADAIKEEADRLLGELA